MRRRGFFSRLFRRKRSADVDVGDGGKRRRRRAEQQPLLAGDAQPDGEATHQAPAATDALAPTDDGAGEPWYRHSGPIFEETFTDRRPSGPPRADLGAEPGASRGDADESAPSPVAPVPPTDAPFAPSASAADSAPERGPYGGSVPASVPIIQRLEPDKAPETPAPHPETLGNDSPPGAEPHDDAAPDPAAGRREPDEAAAEPQAEPAPPQADADADTDADTEADSTDETAQAPTDADTEADSTHETAQAPTDADTEADSTHEEAEDEAAESVGAAADASSDPVDTDEAPATATGAQVEPAQSASPQTAGDLPTIVPIRGYYVARTHDTLRSVAAQFLNAPERWSELRTLNAAHPGIADIDSDALLPEGTALALPGDPLVWGRPDPVHLWTLAETFLFTAWGREPTPEEVVPFWRGLSSGALPAGTDPPALGTDLPALGAELPSIAAEAPQPEAGAEPAFAPPPPFAMPAAAPEADAPREPAEEPLDEAAIDAEIATDETPAIDGDLRYTDVESPTDRGAALAEAEAVAAADPAESPPATELTRTETDTHADLHIADFETAETVAAEPEPETVEADAEIHEPEPVDADTADTEVAAEPEPAEPEPEPETVEADAEIHEPEPVDADTADTEVAAEPEPAIPEPEPAIPEPEPETVEADAEIHEPEPVDADTADTEVAAEPEPAIPEPEPAAGPIYEHEAQPVFETPASALDIETQPAADLDLDVAVASTARTDEIDVFEPPQPEPPAAAPAPGAAAAHVPPETIAPPPTFDDWEAAGGHSIDPNAPYGGLSSFEQFEQAQQHSELEAPRAPQFLPSVTGTSVAADTGVGRVKPVGRSMAGTAIGDAMMLWQLARRRRQSNRAGPSGDEMELSLQETANSESLMLIAAAMRHLWAVTVGQGEPSPDVLAVRVGTYGFEVLLAQPAEAPPGWRAASSGHVLELPPGVTARDLGAVGSGPSLCPALVPVGNTFEGPLLLNLQQIGTLAVSGPENAAASLIAAIVTTLASSPMAEGIEIAAVGLDHYASLPGWERVRLVPFDSPELDAPLAAYPNSDDRLTIVFFGPGHDLLIQRVAQKVAAGDTYGSLVGATSAAGTRWPWSIHVDSTSTAVVHPVGITMTAAQAPSSEYLAQIEGASLGGLDPSATR